MGALQNEFKWLISKNEILLSNKKNICDYYNSPFILYCRNHDRVCHRNCNGEKLCLHFDKNDSSNCEVCNCTKSSHRYIMNYNEQKEKE